MEPTTPTPPPALRPARASAPKSLAARHLRSRASVVRPRSVEPPPSALSTTRRRRPWCSRPSAAPSTVPTAAGTALSINQIYKRSGPGVVQITSTIGSSTSDDRPVPAGLPGARLGLRARPGGAHRHQLPRHRRSDLDPGAVLERRHAESDAGRQRPVHRRGAAQGRRAPQRPHPARSGRFVESRWAMRSSRSATRSASSAR